MKINYQLNNNNEIISWHTEPYNYSEPFIDVLSLDQIYLHISQVIDGEFISNEEKFNQLVAIEEYNEPLLKEIKELKEQLSSTDYLTMKYMEGQLSEEDWNAAKIQRQEWRDRINELEQELK